MINKKRAVIFLSVSICAMIACGRDAGRDEEFHEETHVDTGEVPESFRDNARDILASVGPDARCVEWFWDREGGYWECRVEGMPSATELDLDRHGVFDEYEIEIPLTDVVANAPNVATLIAETCGESDRAKIEISIRRRPLLEQALTLEALWGEDAVFLEVQCSGGEDFEIDAFGTLFTSTEDDREELQVPD